MNDKSPETGLSDPHTAVESPRPKVTVYIPCHNYGRFLDEAIGSVRRQILDSWELLVIDDGSADDTGAIAERHRTDDPVRIRVVRNEAAQGLFACANRALDLARGQYFVRLDADDYFDESALLVMTSYLDRHPDVALVYPNYFYVDERGSVLRVENRKRVGTEAKLLDLPAHGAGTVIRKRVLKTVGGYSTDANAQDGWDLWLKIANRYAVANVSTPLFYYRQHGNSLSRDNGRIMDNRRRIKRSLVERDSGAIRPATVAVIPVKNTYADNPDIALRPIAGRPLIDYTIEDALGAGLFGTVFVSTDDPRVAEHCARTFPSVRVNIRPEALSHSDVSFTRVVHDTVAELEARYDVFADVLVVLNVHTPLRRTEHVLEAVDTLLLHDCDSVISVVENADVHYWHGTNGLEPLNPAMAQSIRLERESLFIDNRSIRTLWRDTLGPDDLLGQSIGHIVMNSVESLSASNENNIWLIERHLSARNRDCSKG